MLKRHDLKDWDDFFNEQLDDPKTDAEVVSEIMKRYTAEYTIPDIMLSINIDQAIGRMNRLPIQKVRYRQIEE